MIGRVINRSRYYRLVAAYQQAMAASCAAMFAIRIGIAWVGLKDLLRYAARCRVGGELDRWPRVRFVCLGTNHPTKTVCVCVLSFDPMEPLGPGDSWVRSTAFWKVPNRLDTSLAMKGCSPVFLWPAAVLHMPLCLLATLHTHDQLNRTCHFASRCYTGHFIFSFCILHSFAVADFEHTIFHTPDPVPLPSDDGIFATTFNGRMRTPQKNLGGYRWWTPRGCAFFKRPVIDVDLIEDISDDRTSRRCRLEGQCLGIPRVPRYI